MNGFEYLNWKIMFLENISQTENFKLLKTVAAQQKVKHCLIHIFFLRPTKKLVDKFNRQLGVADKRYDHIHKFPSKDRVNPLPAILEIILSRSFFCFNNVCKHELLFGPYTFL